jgi:hypothetical protein
MASSHPSKHPNKPPITSILDSPTSYLLCELTIDGRTAADCALCRDIIQSACRACIGSIGTGLASMSVVKQCSPSVFIVSVATSHLSDVWAAITIASSFEKRGTSTLSLRLFAASHLKLSIMYSPFPYLHFAFPEINVLKTGQTLLSICGPSRRRIDGSVLNWPSFSID